jgi:hypothetical protein
MICSRAFPAGRLVPGGGGGNKADALSRERVSIGCGFSSKPSKTYGSTGTRVTYARGTCAVMRMISLRFPHASGELR